MSAPILDTSEVPVLDLETVYTRPRDRYALAARDVLRKSLRDLWSEASTVQKQQDYAARSIEVTPDRRPIAHCGDCYFAITAEEAIEGGPTYEIVRVAIQVHITVRTILNPREYLTIRRDMRSSLSSTQPRKILSWLKSAVIASLHNRTAILDVSNAGYPNEPPLLHQLIHQSPAPVTLVGPDHFLADSDQNENPSFQPAGMVQMLNFDGGLWMHNTTPCPS